MYTHIPLTSAITYALSIMAILLLHHSCSLLPFPTSLLLRSDPDLRLSHALLRLRLLAPRQTFACLQAPISHYDLCTFMDTLGLYFLLASCSLQVIRLH